MPVTPRRRRATNGAATTAPRSRQRRHAVRSRRLELAAAAVASIAGLWVGLCGPTDAADEPGTAVLTGPPEHP
ncbi:hypothetical protein [Streptomyces sp. B6B3]|uniref:hypothetical protein n=1 Tax=Streptomyces sp. B6B3 TaxID=3153570 RepID=UPI00325E8326